MYSDPQRDTALILIVDDVASNILVIREAVRDMADIRFATSGQEALDMIQRAQPDLVLLDIEMPGIDGFAVCDAIKADPRLQDVSVIFVTSHNSGALELEALNRGGVDFLQKPLNVPVARARIATHLELRLKSRQLAAVQRNLVDIVQHLPAFVAHWGEDLENLLCNDAEGKWFGIPAREMWGKPLQEVIGAANFSAVRKHINAVLNGGNPSFDMVVERPDVPPRQGQVSLVRRSSPNQAAGFLMLITDITDRKNAELALFDEKERFRVTLNSIGDAVITTDPKGRVTFLNPIAETMTGWMSGEALGQPIELVMPLRDGADGQPLLNPARIALDERRVVGMTTNCSVVRRDGCPFDIEQTAAPIRDYVGEISGAIIVFHDVSEAQAMAVKMTHLANHDSLTNLPNRMLLRDRMQQALRKAEREQSRVALFCLDIDHFKAVNDTLSHTIGDILLQEVARRLREARRTSDTVSRQGGDEFIILMPDVEHLEQVSALADRLLKAVSEPCWIAGNRFDLSVSIGVSLYPDDSTDMEELYRHADAAMYRAKHEGRNRHRFYSAEIEEALHTRQTLERRMRVALEEGQFEVFYQPKVDVLQSAVVGAEALVRWRTEEDELILPLQFVPLAEETGMIVPLGFFVLEQACLDARRWQDAGLPIRVAVNVSAVQIAEYAFVSSVYQIIESTGIRPQLLELEITEGVLAKDIDRTLETITALKALGVSIAIDDFGTGYSSLAYLEQFPIDVLKIDQSFVRTMKSEKSTLAIITAIIHMAHALDMTLVAEGVETEEQMATLLDLGCPIVQGVLYSPALPAEAMTRYLRDASRSLRVQRA